MKTTNMFNNKRAPEFSSERQIQKRKRVSSEDDTVIDIFSTDILHHVITFFVSESGLIDGQTLRSLSLVSKKWKAVVSSPSLWSIPIPATERRRGSVNFSLAIRETISGKPSFMGFNKVSEVWSCPNNSGAARFSVREKATGKGIILSLAGSEEKEFETITEAYEGHFALQENFLKQCCQDEDYMEETFPRGIQILNERVVRWYYNNNNDNNRSIKNQNLITIPPSNNKDNQVLSISHLLKLQTSFGLQNPSRCHIQMDSWANIVDWILEVVECFDLDDKTAHITMGFVDRVISTSHIQIKKANYQLVSGACLLIASKCCNKPISRMDIALCADNSFSEKDLMRVEEYILEQLKWKLAFPTTLDFIDVFCNALGLEEDNTSLQMMRYISELTLQSPIYLAYKPSVIAASCVVLARFSVQQEDGDLWPEILANETNYSLTDLSDCTMDISRMLDHTRSRFPDLIIISRRYRTKTRGCVSKISIPSVSSFATIMAYQER